MTRCVAVERIDARVLAGLAPQVARAGLDPDAIGRAAGLGPLAAPSASRDVELACFVRFLEAVGGASGDPAFAWQLGRDFVPSAMRDLFPGIVRPTLGETLAGVVETIGRLQSGSLLRMRVGHSLAIVEYRVLDPSIWPRARDAEFTFGFLEGIVRHFAGNDFMPEGIAFEHEAGSSGKRLDRRLGLACIYGETVNRFALPVSMLSLGGGIGAAPPGQADIDQTAWAAGAADRPAAGLADRVRLAILALIGEGEISQERIAVECGMSERTLRRRLRAEGLRFRDLIERVRMDYAREMIVRTSLPLAEIGRRLGYRQQPDFSRAFRRAEGLAPLALRLDRDAAGRTH